MNNESKPEKFMIDRIKVENLLNRLREYSFETYQHSWETAKIAKIIARTCGFSEYDVDLVYYAGLLHDVGKMSIPKEIVHSKGTMTAEEFMIMKTHPVYSYEMLYGFPQDLRDLVLHHHEKLNGTGYPDGLFESEISELNKILTVADITSALNSKRSYKARFEPSKIQNILNRGVLSGELSQKYVRVAIQEYVNQFYTEYDME